MQKESGFCRRFFPVFDSIISTWARLSVLTKKYDVPGLHPHKLRHTFASIAITNGADVASVSEKLGHNDKAVTLRMYTHADQESMKRASQIFRDALKKAGQA